MTEAAARATLALGELLEHVGSGIEVHGHVAPDEMSADLSASPWELSLARAVAIAAALRGAGVPGAVRALGYGDSRARYLSSELPVETRRRLATRIDVVIRTSARRGDSHGP